MAVVKFNESRRDGGSSVCGAAVGGLFKCSSVDAIWAAAAAADRNRISSALSPDRLTYPPESRHVVQSPGSSHMAANQRFVKLCLWDRDVIGTQMYGSGTVAGLILSGAGRARDSCLRERAGAGWHNLSRATL